MSDQRRSARWASQPPERDLLSLIRRRHAEYDVRLAVSNAIHHAEVVLVGPDAGGLEFRLGEQMRLCGGRLVHELSDETRFAVPSPQATAAQISAVEETRAELVSERELVFMVEVFIAVSGIDDVRSAARRAREDAARQSHQPVTDSAPADEKARGFHTHQRNKPERRLATLTDMERSLEEHARRVRTTDASGAFREHREIA